jgi:hypothetical protein
VGPRLTPIRPMTPFDEDAVLQQVRTFCKDRDVEFGSRIRVVPHLTAAFDVVTRKGADTRWRTIVCRSCPHDFPDARPVHPGEPTEQAAYDCALRQYDRRNRTQLAGPKRPWWTSQLVTSASRWARISKTIDSARAHGLGWLVPASRDLLIVPRPILRTPEGQTGVLHDDTGSVAVEWADGTGFHFLRGAYFDAASYTKVIESRLTIEEVAAFGNADQRSIALTYLTFESLVRESRARLLDVGAKGTALYRLSLPTRIARDRVRGYGGYDYFIHMRDASHPEREFIEWVDPKVGVLSNAELCQAHAFGITLEQWLSITQDG